MRDLVILGTGGVGRALRQFVEDCNAVEPRWRFRGFVDDAGELPGIEPVLPMLGPVARLEELGETDVLVGIGWPAPRKTVVDRLRRFPRLAFPSLVHPRVYLPSSVPVGEGTIVYPGACIETDAKLGAFVLINHNATIGHDTVLEDFTTISPGCSIGGNAAIETGAFVGIGACTLQGIRIGADAIVGAGAAVTADVGAGLTVVGVPARPRSGR